MTKSEEARAAAEAAIGARQKAVDAKAAAEAAGGADTALNEALTAAEQAATTAETHALTLSQSLPAQDDAEKKKEKLLRKRKFIDKDLKALGVDVEDADEDEDEEEDDDKPMTRGDYKKLQVTGARNTAKQLADAIVDPLDRAAVVDSLKLVVPSGDSEKDFKAAVAIANIDRNSKILEEIQRKPIARTAPTGTGAPARREEEFVPTAHEQMFMSKMGLTKADILKARAAGAK